MTRKVLNPINMATIIVIAYMTMPILSVIISTSITTYTYMLLTVFIVGFIVLSGGIKRLNSIVYLLAPFIVYVGCTFATNGGSILLWGYQSMLLLLPTLLGYYFIYYRPEAIELFSKTLIIFVLVTAITTIIGIIQFPNSARILATIATSDDPESIKYTWHNIGGYTFVYFCVLLYPILILAYKLKRINGIMFFAIVGIIFTLIIISEYTIAFILLIITSVLFFFGKKFNAKNLLIVGIVMFLSIFLFWNIYRDFLLWLAGLVSSKSVSDRLIALSGGVTSLESFEDNRIELYRSSISGFFSSPVFGSILGNRTTKGGHSFILDALASYGILGGAAIAFVYRNVYRFFFKPFSNNTGYGYILWAFAQAIVLSAVNTGMWIDALTFFIPVLLTFIYKTNSEEDYESSLDS